MEVSEIIQPNQSTLPELQWQPLILPLRSFQMSKGLTLFCGTRPKHLEITHYIMEEIALRLPLVSGFTIEYLADASLTSVCLWIGVYFFSLFPKFSIKRSSLCIKFVLV